MFSVPIQNLLARIAISDQNLNIQSFLVRLKPGTLFGWWIYVILVLLIITMLMQKSGSSMTITLLLAASIMCGLIVKVQAFPPGNFLGYVCAMLMAVFPLVVVGMTRTPKSRLPGGIAVVLALIFLVAFWASNASLQTF